MPNLLQYFSNSSELSLLASAFLAHEIIYFVDILLNIRSPPCKFI
nr:MAG TPA: hypothetical protein [Bacteriophage sp.]